jgi:hypothetical protein
MYSLGTYFLSLYRTRCKFLHKVSVTFILKNNGVYQRMLTKIIIMKLRNNPSSGGKVVSRGEMG